MSMDFQRFFDVASDPKVFGPAGIKMGLNYFTQKTDADKKKKLYEFEQSILDQSYVQNVNMLEFNNYLSNQITQRQGMEREEQIRAQAAQTVARAAENGVTGAAMSMIVRDAEQQALKAQATTAYSKGMNNSKAQMQLDKASGDYLARSASIQHKIDSIEDPSMLNTIIEGATSLYGTVKDEMKNQEAEAKQLDKALGKQTSEIAKGLKTK